MTIRFIIPSVFINKLDCSVCTGLTQVLSDQYRHSSLVCVYVRLLKSGDQCLQAVSVKNTPYSSSICLIFWALIIIIIIVIITIIIIIIIIISFTQCIYTYIPDTNYVPRECSVAAILLLLFMVLIPSVSVFNLLYFYISTFRSMCAVPNMVVFCSYFYYYWKVPAAVIGASKFRMQLSKHSSKSFLNPCGSAARRWPWHPHTLGF